MGGSSRVELDGLWPPPEYLRYNSLGEVGGRSGEGREGKRAYDFSSFLPGFCFVFNEACTSIA